MSKINRREFVQSGIGCLLAGWGFRPDFRPAQVHDLGQSIRVEGAGYTWEWSRETGQFRILNRDQEVITRGPLQPALLLQKTGQSLRRMLAARLEQQHTEGNRVTWTYAESNGPGKLTLAWRFEDAGMWIEPVIYEGNSAEDVVSLYLFAEAETDKPKPALHTDFLILPGICEGEGVSPIVDSDIGLTLRTSLGRAGNGITQQWALPCHYFAGFRRASWGTQFHADGLGSSQAFCCGLSQLPNADLYVEQKDGRGSLLFDYRSDLWGHLRGPGKFTLGAGLFWSFAPNYYQAIRGYYAGLLTAGIIHNKMNSARKNQTLLSPQYCTWGQQMAMNKDGDHFDQASLEKCYDDLRAAGMQARLFSIDDRWEGTYGSLEHSAERFPHFEQFLDRVRADGIRIGMWAAFMRCEDPHSLGLTPEQMLRQADGKPYFIKYGPDSWYILDFTRPEVAQVLAERARQFVRRYKPDLIKFDFGYEIPVLGSVAPRDMNWAGERMLSKALDVIVSAMRQENPDIVLMYYHLSPLFTEYLDLHSSDDLGMTKGEYEIEANRRFFFSSLCAEFGMPTYGSSGYNWASAPEIWFDSPAVGSVGSLIAFEPSDDIGGNATARLIAKYNGLTHLVRSSNQFTIEPLDPVYSSATRGAHASSWARFEEGKPVLVTLRMQRLDGGPGTSDFGGFIHTTASVVIASRNEDALQASTHLGVVPYQHGVLTLKRDSASQTSAQMTQHFFGGESKSDKIAITNGVLEVQLQEAGSGTPPLEWIEIKISDDAVGIKR